jgi:putative transposase
MGRIARVVVPGIPHHVTQRGNRRQRTFFDDSDFDLYLYLWKEYGLPMGLELLSYCLMPNHVHLALKPETVEALSRGVGEVHRRYTSIVNRREGWTGWCWQGRYKSCPMDDLHLLRAVRYILWNPVRAGLVERPEHWPYSSALSHLTGKPDPVLTPAPLDTIIRDWRKFLDVPGDTSYGDLLELHARTGRPLGSDGFLRDLEKRVGRRLRPQKRGRKREVHPEGGGSGVESPVSPK